MKAFTYIIKCIPTNQVYYGVRYSKNSNPDDLWRTYFTSSKRVHELIRLYGKDAFVYEIRKTFKDSQSAWEWEQKVLRRMKIKESDKWINVHVIGSKFRNDGGFCYTYSEKRIKAIKKANTGRVVSDETRQKMSDSFRGRKYSLDMKNKLADSKSQQWVVTCPDGHDILIKNLAKFCRDNNLDNASIMKTVPSDGNMWGKSNHCKGYRVRKFGQEKHIPKPKFSHSKETKEKLSQISKNRFQYKESHPMFGKQHSEITKNKIRKAKLKVT